VDRKKSNRWRGGTLNHGGHNDPFKELKESHESYKVFDEHYESIGRVDDLFVDENDQLVYIGTRTGFLETRSTPIPIELIRVNDKRRVIEVARSRGEIEHAPSFEGDEDLAPELEDRIRSYFGLGGSPTYTDPDRAPGEARDRAIEEGLVTDERVDLVPGERREPQPTSETISGYTERAEPQERLTEHGAGEPETERTTPRDAGKGWARGTERLRPGDGEHDAAGTARIRRIRR
jgi:hypothetical protein